MSEKSVGKRILCGELSHIRDQKAILQQIRRDVKARVTDIEALIKTMTEREWDLAEKIGTVYYDGKKEISQIIEDARPED